MLKVLAGGLSATFNIDGQHFDRYVGRSNSIVKSICDLLMLHDQILIPTQDYITAAGLVRVLGERNVLLLMEEERLRFLRMRGFFGYVRGSGPDGRIVTMNDPNQMKSVSAPIDRSIDASLLAIDGLYKDRRHLKNRLINYSDELELQEVVDATHRDTYNDLSQTTLWREEFRLPNPDLVALPGAEKMGVRVLGPGMDVANNVIDACLALELMNIELYLAKKFDCINASTSSPIGDSISLKVPRLARNRNAPKKLWNFLDVAGVPDVSESLLADNDKMEKFFKLTRGRDAEVFRRWFHENAHMTERELLKGYIDVLHTTPWIHKKGGRSLRMAASVGLSLLGLGVVLDVLTSAIDNFVVDRFFRGRGVKIFVEDLRSFAGRIVPRD